MIEANNIYHGDCYELIKQLPDNSVDCIYTDIPYEYEQGGATKKSNVAKNIRKLEEELKQANIYDGIDYAIFNEFVRVLKNINIFIWCSKAQILPILNWFNENTDCTFQILVWCKTNPTPMCNGNWLPDIEYCLYFNRGTKLNNGYNLKSKYYVSKKNVEDKKKYIHPTIKPLELVERHLKHTTQEGDVVLDAFVGSGTTCVACKNINRKYIGFEINENYYNIAQDRLNGIEANGQIVLL